MPRVEGPPSAFTLCAPWRSSATTTDGHEFTLGVPTVATGTQSSGFKMARRAGRSPRSTSFTAQLVIARSRLSRLNACTLFLTGHASTTKMFRSANALPDLQLNRQSSSHSCSNEKWMGAYPGNLTSGVPCVALCTRGRVFPWLLKPQTHSKPVVVSQSPGAAVTPARLPPLRPTSPRRRSPLRSSAISLPARHSPNSN